MSNYYLFENNFYTSYFKIMERNFFSEHFHGQFFKTEILHYLLLFLIFNFFLILSLFNFFISMLPGHYFFPFLVSSFLQIQILINPTDAEELSGSNLGRWGFGQQFVLLSFPCPPAILCHP